MKELIKIILASILFSLALGGCESQREGGNGDYVAKAALPQIVITPAEDTLITSTSADTVTISLATLYSRSSYSLQVNADQLSGTTNGNCFLETNTDMAGSDWVRGDTIALSSGLRAFQVGTIYRGTVRCRCYAPSSTQNTAIRVDFVAVPE